MTKSGLLLIAWSTLIGAMIAAPLRLGALVSGDIVALLLLTAFAAALTTRRGRWTPTVLDLPIAAWSVLSIAWCAMGQARQALAPSPYDSPLYGGGPHGPEHVLAIQLAACAAYYLAVWTMEATRESANPAAVLSTSIEVGSVLLVLFCAAEQIRVNSLTERLEAGFTNSNLLAAFLILCAPTIAAGLGFGGSAARKAGRALLLAAIVAALFLTRSRGAEAGLAAALIVLGAAWARASESRRAPRLAALAVAAAISIMGLAWLIHSHRAIADRLDHSVSDGQRKVAWRAAWDIFEEHPLTGVCLGAFPAAMEALHLREPAETDAAHPGLTVPARHLHAHNAALQAASERGIGGLLLMLWATAIVVGQIARTVAAGAATNPATLGAAAAATGWIVQNAFDYTSWFPPVAILLAVQLAVLSAAGSLLDHGSGLVSVPDNTRR